MSGASPRYFSPLGRSSSSNLSSGRKQVQIYSSLIPELIWASESLIFLGVIIGSVFLACKLDGDWSSWSWYSVFTPFWLVVLGDSVLLLYSICAPHSYLVQVESLNSLRVGDNNPSVVELIPMVLGCVGRVFLLWCLLVFSVLLAVKLSATSASSLSWYATFSPLFVAEGAFLIYSILIVDGTFNNLLLGLTSTAFTVLVVLQLQMVISWNGFLVVSPVLVFLGVYVAILVYRYFREGQSWDLTSFWKWFFALMAFLWTAAFVILLVSVYQHYFLYEGTQSISFRTTFELLEIGMVCALAHHCVDATRFLELWSVPRGLLEKFAQDAV